MRIKLLQDIMELHGIKVAHRPGQEPVVFTKDAVIAMSDASGQKYIAEGKGVEVVDDVKSAE